MKIGFIGLGKMGAFMVERLLNDGHEVVVYNRTPEKTREIEMKGAIASYSLEELVEKLPSPKIVWMMIPSGDPVQKTIGELIPLLNKEDIIIDGGNSYYKDTVRRSAELEKVGINYLDAGTSGGIWGLKLGYCVMVGGEKNIFEQCEPVFKTLAPENGYKYIGKAGAGHYVAQFSVENLKWLTDLQMIDGLALGETTPGPLVMVLAFVGFMAGYNHFDSSLLMGSLGLIATVYFTFLPCFYFIFAGAPLIERTQKNNKLKTSLSIVTAAVVGIILNLTIYFGKAVIFPNGISVQSIDIPSFIWILISLIALYKYKVNIILWIVISAVFGLVYYLLAG